MGYAIVMCALVVAQAGEGDKVVKRLPTPQDAFALAHQDVLRVAGGKDPSHGPADLPYLRYIWVRTGDLDDARAISGALHYVSRSNQAGEGTRPVPLAKGALLRADLRRYVRSRAYYQSDLGDWLRQWERFAFDPECNTILTPDTLRLARFPGGPPRVKTTTQVWEDKPRDVAPYVQDGVTYRQKWFKRDVVTDVPVTEVADLRAVRNPNGAPVHVDAMIYQSLVGYLQTQTPLITAEYFTTRSQSSIQEDGLHGLVYGGNYFELAGIPEAAKGGNDELELYKTLGIDTGGKSLEDFFNALGSDRKAAVFFSGVTGRPRQFYWFPSLASANGSMVFVTRDSKVRNIDSLTHAIGNLLEFKADAAEVIFDKSNGFLGKSLYNGKGKLQRQVPDDIASDATVPSPFPRRLQAGISCKRCHGPDNGLKPHDNDIHTILRAGFKIFGGQHKDDLERLKELYQGDPKPVYEAARVRFAAAVLRATGPWKRSKDQTDVVRLLNEQIAGLYHRYNYELVTPKLALRDLGFEVPEGDETKWLKTLLLSDAADEHFAERLGFVPQDFRLVGLMAGIPITRTDWQLAYSYAQARADRAWQQIRSRPKKAA